MKQDCIWPQRLLTKEQEEEEEEEANGLWKSGDSRCSHTLAGYATARLHNVHLLGLQLIRNSL